MIRIRELDSARGIWAILILVYHSERPPLSLGWSRVDFFFVLSGYLATRRLLDPARRQQILFKELVGRSFRLLPAYYLLIAVGTLLADPRDEPDCLARLIAAATLTQNAPLYWSGSPWEYCPRYLIHTWTLAIELQFSLLLPLLHRMVGTVALVPLSLILTINAVLIRSFGLHPWTLLGRSDGLALGMLLAVALSTQASLRQGRTRIGLSLTLMVGLAYMALYLAGPTPVPQSFNRPLGTRESLALFAMNLIYVGLVGLVACYAGCPALGILRARWLVRLGGLSYGIYLYSFVAIGLGESIIDCTPGVEHVWATPLALALAIVAAAASRATVERPLIMRVGRHLRAEGSGPPSLIAVGGR